MNERDPERRTQALLDFLELYQADRRAGSSRARGEYEARFPGFEELIGAELELQQGRRSALPADASAVERLGEQELLGELARRSATPRRYRRGPELGRGASSRVYRAHDAELERDVAMKVHEGPRSATLTRFIREARVIGRLEHPGVVPVHEIGLGEDGRLFFTMRLVEGRSLKEWLAQPDSAERRRRVLEAVIRVCDTLAYAHARGVVHRDVKPSNVMLGAYGEVYLVDWGLARASRVEAADAAPTTAEGDPLETLPGQVLGTPAYMSPEQARGEGTLGPRSDVYAVGAILHHFLTGRAPFCDADTSPSTREVLARVVAGEVPRLAPELQEREPELCSIARRAMTLDPAGRYQGCDELALDLRAFLDGRAVAAHGHAIAYRLAKWVRRNRTLSVGLLAVGLLAWFALHSSGEARARGADLHLLADLRGPLELLDGLAPLWPAVPEHRAAIAGWIERAEGLLARGRVYEEELERLRTREELLPVTAEAQEAYTKRRAEQLAVGQRALDETRAMLVARERGGLAGGLSIEKLRINIASLEQGLAAIRARPLAPVSGEFRDARTQLFIDRLEQFLSELDFVVGREAPRERLLLARAALALAERAEAHAPPGSWEAAAAALREDARFAGLELSPQPGLVPLGPDPDSGLQEFAHVQSGEVPRRDEHGRLVIEGDSALVLVLVPGGRGPFGAQASDPASEVYDPHAHRHESPPLVFSQPLDPFLVAKHELTLGQWCRLSGADPAQHFDEHRTLDMPALGMSGEWSQVVLSAYGLELPTSLRWEHAARAGTTTIWWCGDDLASIAGCGNVADKLWQRGMGYADTDVAGAVPFEDGYAGFSPVGRYRANAFGLHDTLGNAAEWCRDVTIPYMTSTLSGSAELFPQPEALQIVRGGHAAEGAFGARSAAREYVRPTFVGGYFGLRPSRELAR